MNRLARYCIILLVAESIYFTLKFIGDKFATVRDKPLGILEKETETEERLGKCHRHTQITKKCQILFQGGEVNSIRLSDRKEVYKECSLEELVKTCSKLRSEHGYDDKPVSDEELKFPLAFSIKMHKDSKQVERLLRTIYRSHNFYCIHVDLKASDETYNLIKSVADCLNNVVILPKRLNVVYSSIRLVAVEFACMKLSMESRVKWKYYINLTGQEFVLRTNLELVKILKIFNGANDVESYPFTQMFRIEFYFVLINDRFVKTKAGPRSFKNTTLYKGSAYGMFSRDFVDFVLTDDFVSGFYQWLNTTYAPEEAIFSTINRLPFTPGGCPRSNIKHDDLTHASRTVIWAYEPKKCHGKFVRAVCIFGSGDLPWLHRRPQIVANKFDENIDSVVLDCLEQSVNERTYSESFEELNWYYYRNLPQVEYYERLRNFKKTKKYLQNEKKTWLKYHSPTGGGKHLK